MGTNYTTIILNNLKQQYAALPSDMETRMGAQQDGDTFIFKAFGRKCVISPDHIMLDDEELADARGVIISLYFCHAAPEPCIMPPLRAFKEFENSMPYAGAFTTHTEQVLVPHAGKIASNLDSIFEVLDGEAAPTEVGGDLAFIVTPLPKIRLCYILYEADEDFPASVTCLYSANAGSFLPIDALADVGEYASKRMIELVGTA
ncbi:MAG: DUF3786 domain-containing protein [Thermodesulfobacteriota bacterium]|nr:DUF3786 domain-containing protein [Thermodesulfobacteriota bacterium]